MIDKQTYLNTKRYIKSLCRLNVIKLADNMQLNEYERNLLLDLYDGKTKIQVCMERNISPSKYTDDIKLIVNKVHDYKNTYL